MSVRYALAYWTVDDVLQCAKELAIEYTEQEACELLRENGQAIQRAARQAGRKVIDAIIASKDMPF